MKRDIEWWVGFAFIFGIIAVSIALIAMSIVGIVVITTKGV
jgi:hypothetical protein